MIRTRRISLLTAAAALPLAALAIGACGGDDTTGSTSTTPASVTLPKTESGTPATVGVASVGSLGKILVDEKGRTLYLFQKDTGTTSECTGGCAAAWPPLRASDPVAGTSLTASKLATTSRSDGQPQVTYNGHPLYLYSADQKPGDANGQGLNAFGALWYAVSDNGNVDTAAGSNTGSANGY
jgi:predicted lipoprotein with Yx(FWY)xxD motif